MFDFGLNPQHLDKICLKSHLSGSDNIWVGLRSWLLTHIRKPYIACFVKIFVPLQSNPLAPL